MWKPDEPSTRPRPPERRRNVLGGPEEQVALNVLSGAVFLSEPALSEADAAILADEHWQRMSLGERSAFVVETLPNPSYDMDGVG